MTLKITFTMLPCMITACILWLLTLTTLGREESCSKAFGCSHSHFLDKRTRFVLYDVNFGEGFNLKRDVYMRMATFMRGLSEDSKDDWHLILPPWTKQWHWKSEEDHISYLWQNFFEVESLQLYAPVLEIDQFYADYGDTVDEVFVLQHFPEFYEWSGNDGKEMDWSDKWNFSECREHPYWEKSDGTYKFFGGKRSVKAKSVKCVSFQGPSKYLSSIISSTDANSVMFDRAEIATHGMFGDADYWMCRRSMRFAKHLVKEADDFRMSKLKSTDERDGTFKPLDWRTEQPKRTTKGGPYLGVHLRRQDFLRGRPSQVPSLEQSAIQIKNYLRQLYLSSVFVASDMPRGEFGYLRALLREDNFNVHRYRPKKESKFSEGELAIIDQIIASHATFFVGTHESTFSFRIQEEREILGFPISTTFNRFCPNANKNCTPPSKWLIKYPDKLGDFRGETHFEL